jgi:hypothetical protein
MPCFGCGLLAFVGTLSPKSAPPAPPPLAKSQTSAQPQPAPISIPPAGIIRISSDDLIAHFRADGDAAAKVFRDRTVEVTGRVVLVSKTKTGKPVVTFGEVGHVLSPKVECYFEANDDPKVLEGQPCTIRGKCMGKSMGVGTWLQECVVLPSP